MLDFIMDANTMNPDQTAPLGSSLIWVHIVCNKGCLRTPDKMNRLYKSQDWWSISTHMWTPNCLSALRVVRVESCLRGLSQSYLAEPDKFKYRRTSMARTPMAHSPGLARTMIMVPTGHFKHNPSWMTGTTLG